MTARSSEVGSREPQPDSSVLRERHQDGKAGGDVVSWFTSIEGLVHALEAFVVGDHIIDRTNLQGTERQFGALLIEGRIDLGHDATRLSRRW